MRALVSTLELMVRALDPIVFPLALVCGLILAVLALGLMMMCRVRATVRSTVAQTRAESGKASAAVDGLREELNRLAGQVKEVQLNAAVGASPKGTLNWNKRSQVLRLHRRGDDAASIAAALSVPLQEVDLTLKVHHIVMKNI